jgi:hypothetical protein
MAQTAAHLVDHVIPHVPVRSRKTIFGGAVNAQHVSATFEDRFAFGGCRVRGAMRKDGG